MNYSIIVYIVGFILNVEAVLMMLPCVTSLIYHEKEGLAFVASMAICIAVGLPMMLLKKPKRIFYAREGFVAVALSWIALSIGGALPFIFSGSIPDPVNAIFETVSGFTTTGASILNSVEVLPHCVLLWRSFTHWIGGMGVLVFVLTILPQSGGSYMNLMKAESPGPSVSRLVPKVKTTAKILYLIYLLLTVIEMLLLLIGKMPLFDTLCISFGTAGTGGFGVLNDSCASYTTYQQIVITVFMILFGVNFNVYFLILMRKVFQAVQIEEIRYYFGIIAFSITAITLNVWHTLGGGFFRTLQNAAFQVGSIITTTGYSTVDFDQWPMFSKTILVLLMFCGACAGSTGGGVKVSRLVIMVKTVAKEVQIYLHPNAVKKVKMDDKPIPHEVVRATNIFMVVYILVLSFSVLLVALDEFDFTTNFTAVAATLNNIGPGLEKVGPACNFALFSPGVKLVLVFDMLAGRLELFPMLLLFLPRTWKKF